ncbi:DUF6402 family protein [Paraburkholderia sediminicola]|uniref:DUF6402 family protein n=1 Tax=Paraburkholderia sediminicola TaxID=458836 RepID=UPI0038BD8244
MSTAYREKIPYYKINKVLWRWTRCDADRGCYPVPDLAISMTKPPPTLLTQPGAAPSSTSPAQPLTHADRVNNSLDGLLSIAHGVSRVKKWLDTPDPPKPPKTTPARREERATTLPFDLQEIPGAMRKEIMPVSAKLMERWFAGDLNYSPTPRDEVKGLNQNGQPYPPSMIDKTTIKLDWVLKHTRAKVVYDFLQTYERLTTPRAIEALGSALRPLRSPYGKVDAWKLSDQDLKILHKNFEFQLAGVESTFSQKLDQLVSREKSNGGVPDDLTGSLGSFNFYAAVGSATFNRDANRATITSIILYVKDNYTFTDEAGEPSQYLGHWSRDGVVIVPATGAAGLAGVSWPDYPVAVGDMRVRGNVYYPVRNSSFREWQKIHQQGGDFIIFSDYRFVTLLKPVEIEFL